MSLKIYLKELSRIIIKLYNNNAMHMDFLKLKIIKNSFIYLYHFWNTEKEM